jgi:hypothetical protein
MKHVYEGELSLELVEWEGLYISIGGTDLESELTRIFDDKVIEEDRLTTLYKCGRVRITIEQLDEAGAHEADNE